MRIKQLLDYWLLTDSSTSSLRCDALMPPVQLMQPLRDEHGGWGLSCLQRVDSVKGVLIARSSGCLVCVPS